MIQNMFYYLLKQRQSAFSFILTATFITSLILTAKAQPEFSRDEIRMLKERKMSPDSVLYRMSQEKLPMADVNSADKLNFADGNLDTTFNASVTEGFGYANKTIVQPDGKIIVVGLFHRANGVRVNAIARLNADGTTDTSFNTGAGANAAVRTAALQPDGKIIVAGAFTSFNGQAVNRIVRLNADGSIDPGFALTVAFNGQINDVLVLPNGKIMVGGQFSLSSSRLVRLNANGTLDTAIAGFNSSVHTMAITPDNKIVVGGEFSSIRPTIARLGIDGTLDSTFNPPSGGSAPVFKVAVQPDGKILAGGAFRTFNGTSADGLVRLNDSGSIDAVFEITNDPQIENLYVMGIAIQPDGKILAGFFNDDYVSFADVRRFNPDASPDGTFNTFSNNTITSTDLNLLADGKILVNGYFVSFGNQQRLRLLKLNSDGSLDNSFNPAISTVGIVYAIKRQTDGKILVAGDFEYVNGTKRMALARLNADGTLDTSFSLPTGFLGDIYALAVQPDGKIVIGGLFGGDSNFPAFGIARLNANGGFDTGFSNSINFVNVAYSIAIQPDGKIVAGGIVFDVTSQIVALTRFLSNGNGDTSFVTPNLPTGSVRAILLQPNGKIIFGGTFFPLGGGTLQRNGIARLNANGSLDSAFSTFVGNVFALEQQPDGKILAGGFTLNRFSSEGVVDATLNVGTGFNSVIRAVKIQPDGKILLGGFFTSYNSTSVNRLIRISDTGTLDTTFNTGGGPGGTVFALELQNDGKILAGGQFLDFSGTEKLSLARLQNTAIAPPRAPFDFDGDGKSDISVFRPAAGSWYVLGSQSGFTGTQFGISTDKIAPADFDGDGKTDFAVFRDGNWFLLRSQAGFTAIQFGATGDLPRPADFDGDGKADIAVFRPSTGAWFRLNSSNNQFVGTQFGANGDVPVPADFDGDGKADINVFRPSDGGWYRLNSSDGQFVATQFGISEDLPAVGDFDGDGKADLSVFRPSTGSWYRLNSSNGTFFANQFGAVGDVPAVGDFDGDGNADISVFRPSNGGWFRLNSSNGQLFGTQFGQNGDVAIPAFQLP